MGKRKKYRLLIVEVLLGLGIIISACSELDDPLPTVTDLTIHKDGILVPGSPDFHGLLVAQSNNGWDDCRQCHASDFSGGTTPVGCNVVGCHPAINVHQDGITDPALPEFHGKFIAANGWDLVQCSQCHASDYAGGIAAPSCLTCHTQPAGPEACNTCHGNFDDPNIIAPPEDTNNNTSTDSIGVGAHVHHLYANELGAEIECSTCHKVPQNYSDPGHVDSPLPAEIVFNNLAIINIAGSANYNHAAATCSEVYCHGNWEFLKDSSASQFAYTSDKMVGNNQFVIWNKVDGTQALCGSCHNLPPEGHIPADITGCGNCHTGIVDSDGNIIDNTKHINGEANVFGN